MALTVPLTEIFYALADSRNPRFAISQSSLDRKSSSQ